MPVDCSSLGSFVREILQARILEWIFPIQCSNPCLLCPLHWQVGSLPLAHHIHALLLFYHQVMSNSLRSHELQYIRLPGPSLSHWVCSNLCPLNQWCHPTILSSVALFSSVFPSIRVLYNESAFCIRWPKYWSLISLSVLPMNIQHWYSLGLTGLVSLLSKGLSRVFSNTAVLKHQFLG